MRHGGQSGVRIMNSPESSSKSGLAVPPTSLPIPRPPHDQVSILLAKVQALEKKIREHEFHSHLYIPDHTHTPSPTNAKTQIKVPGHAHTPALPAVNSVHKAHAGSTVPPPLKVASKPDTIASSSQIHPTFPELNQPGGTAIALGGHFNVFTPTPRPVPTTTHYIPTAPYQPVQIPPHLSSSHNDGRVRNRPRGGPLHPPPALAVPMIPQPPQVIAPAIPPPRHDQQQHMPVGHQHMDPIAHAPIPQPTIPPAHPPANPAMQDPLPPVMDQPTPPLPPPAPVVPSAWSSTVTDPPVPSVTPTSNPNKNTNAKPVGNSNNVNNNNSNNNAPTTTNTANSNQAPPTEEPIGNANGGNGNGGKRTEWNNNNSGQQRANNLENPPPKSSSSESNQIQTQPPTGEFEGSQAREMVVDQLTGMIAGNQNTSNAERNMVRDWLSGIEELPALFLGLTWAERQNMMRQQTAQSLLNNNNMNSNSQADMAAQTGQGGFYRDPFTGVLDPFYVQTTNSPWNQRSPFTTGWW